MKIRSIKLALVLIIPVMVASAVATNAYPPFLAKAEKFGAKDCAFCHTSPAGGKGWNDRGKWLQAEKKRRGAKAIDVNWLADYKGR
jgi:hypothetical protein